MASKAKPAKGTLLKIGDGGGSEVFTTIGEVLSFTGVGEEVGEIDVTSQDSTGREYISDALPDTPEMSFEVNFVGSNAQQQQLRTDLRAGTLRNFQYVLNDHAVTKTTCAFSAIVKGFDGPSFGAPGEVYKSNITLRRSGLSTWTYAPS